jgi:DMSO/TMAO reductase YedYZ molybdopterin-dependent catalytic subunit
LDVDQLGDTGAMLAFAMNGEALPVQHGSPLRLIVPGWYAVASVKWLTGILVIDEPFAGYYQHDKYQYERELAGHIERQPVTLQQVRALIVEPRADQTMEVGETLIRGVAWSGAAPIARVEVSISDGPWQQAALVGERQRGRWQCWQVPSRLDTRGPIGLRAEATDLAGRTQPERPLWNAQGYRINAVQQTVVNVRSG